jgi:hypothetical protein
MDSGSDSDGAPEELTAVQVRLVLSPPGPDPTGGRFTIRYGSPVYSAQADGRWGGRADSPVRGFYISVPSIWLTENYFIFWLD